MATRIGCDNLVYAIMTTEDTISAEPVYGIVKQAPGVIHINVNPNASQETLFADDGPSDTATTLGKVDVEINKAELTTENKSDLLGHQVDTNGAIVYSDNDVPPWVAIGFRTLKSNGKYRYVWLYKGKFTDPEDNNETKGDSINFQTDTINGQFVKLNKVFSVNSKSVRPWKYEIDGDNVNASEGLMGTWFSTVKMPNSTVSPAGSLAVTYAAGTATGTTKATITGTAGTGNRYAYKIGATAFTTPDAGALITGTTDYVSGADINGVDATTNKFIGIYELTAANTAVKFNAHTVISTEIKS